MDQQQPTGESKLPRFPLVGVLISAIVLSVLTFGGFAVSAYSRYEQKEKPQAQVRTYLNYLDSCLGRIDNIKKHGLPEASYWDEVAFLSYDEQHPLPPNDKKGRERGRRVIRMMTATLVWGDLADKCLDNLDEMRAEVVKVKAAVVATVGEDASHLTLGERQTLEAFSLPNLKIEDRDVRYYLNEDKSAMVSIPIVVGIAVVAVTFACWLLIVVLNAISPGGSAAGLGSVLLPWTYPHLGWRRLAFVFAPLFGCGLFLFLLVVRKSEYAITISIVALVTGAPLLLLGREIGVWVRKGFTVENAGQPSSPKSNADPREERP